MVNVTNYKNCERGFTLGELITVLAVIGILSGIAIPQLLEMKTRATITAAKQTLVEFANAAQLFQQDRGYYPHSIYYDTRLDLEPLSYNGMYIQDTNVPDPFQRVSISEQIESELGESFSLSSSNTDSKHGFIYVHYPDFLGDDFSRYQGIGVYSIGPDRSDSLLSLYPLPNTTQLQIRRRLYSVYGETALQPVVIFSPTNGVASDGDFGVFRGEFNGFVPSDNL